MELHLLRPGGGVGVASGTALPRPGPVAVAVHRLPDCPGAATAAVTGTEGVCAVGGPPRAVVRGGRVDCVSADGNARDDSFAALEVPNKAGPLRTDPFVIPDKPG